MVEHVLAMDETGVRFPLLALSVAKKSRESSFMSFRGESNGGACRRRRREPRPEAIRRIDRGRFPLLVANEVSEGKQAHLCAWVERGANT